MSASAEGGCSTGAGSKPCSSFVTSPGNGKGGSSSAGEAAAAAGLACAISNTGVSGSSAGTWLGAS
eukprot:7105505-Lingulodinium_polyedra.AAC.1